MIALACAAVAIAVGAAQVRAQNRDDQVIARIGSTQITRAMLREEMPGGVDNPATEHRVLEGMIARKLLADEARHEGLDRTPLGAIVLARAADQATVDVLEKKLAGTPPTVSDDQARAFIIAHPTMFGQRRLIAVNQFLVQDPSKSTLDELKAANTMSAFEDVLSRERVDYQRGSTVLDTLSMPPAAAAQIGAFKTGDVFIAPLPGGAYGLSGVTTNTASPLIGPSAERVARMILARSAMAQKVQTAAGAIIKAGQSEVKINPQYLAKKS